MIMEKKEFQREMINGMVELSRGLANLHKVISSPNGNYFNSALLHELRKRLNEDQLEEFRKKLNVGEYERHIHKFLNFNLITEENIDGKKVYERTKLGEQALNAMKGIEAKIGLNKAREIYECGLGINYINLFLKLYGKKKFFLSRKKYLEIKYTPNQILKQFNLPRNVERSSVIHKFVESELLVCEDGYFYLDTIRARSFYQYLKRLYEILEDIE